MDLSSSTVTQTMDAAAETLSPADSVEGESEKDKAETLSPADSVEEESEKDKAETLSPADSVEGESEKDKADSGKEESDEETADSGEEETADSGEEESERKNSESDDQKWGFDSFDGSDYSSPEEPPEDDEDFQFRRYSRHYHESQGFKVDDDMLPKCHFEGLRGVDLDAYFVRPDFNGRQYMEIMANVAIDKYNLVEEKTITLDHIVRAVLQPRCGIKAYITFMAKESPQGDLVEYQAKAERKGWQKTIHPIFCRPSPPLKTKSD